MGPATPTPRLAMFANIDLSGIMRGRSFPIARLDALLEDGLPWVPANLLISPLNTIPNPNPFGPMGEVRLQGDPDRRMVLPAQGARPAMAVYVADIAGHDGTPWLVCPRTQLRAAIDRLEREHGLVLRVGFEQELYVWDLQDRPTPAFSLAGSRAISDLAEEVYATLATADARLDQFVAEYGANQFEVASPPLEALRAADEAVLVREAIRDAARARGARASFAPKPRPDLPGSGVHIHLSLWTRDGRPATAFSSPGGIALSAEAGAFTAGILRGLESVMAFTLGSPNSFDRLQPSHWVGVFRAYAVRNREAAIRLCPRAPGAEGEHSGASLEFRLVDASASPHLALAALLQAGIDGLDAKLDPPPHVEGDPAALDPAERARLGVDPVPSRLEDVLAAAAGGDAPVRWFGDLMWSALQAARRNDLLDAERAGDAYAEKVAAAV